MTDQELARVANEVRRGIVTGVHAAKAGHPGGSLSVADILTYLYFEDMNVDPADPHKADRDRLVLSKGHAAPALYSVLASRGFFPVEELETLRHIGSRLQGHPNMNDTPGVDMSTGSLGQGVSAAVGMALAAKHWHEGWRTYAILGDKFRAFKFNVIEVADGNDMAQVREAFQAARAHKGEPTCIVAETIKGKGVSFMEDQVGWHGKAPNDEQYAQAMAELEAAGKEL